ncbi:ABC transporter ATP-binding protein [Synergistales bacterium]|nr:ABC transporter ATP-binding protein [Synergistales bacterium]
MTTIVETKNVSKRFGGLQANRDISVKVEEHCIYGLIGPNGAGKTTFLNCILGVHTPEEGSVWFEGNDITGFKPFKVAQLGIGRTFQIVKSMPQFTAAENVMIGGIFANRQNDHEARRNALDFLSYVNFPMPPETLAANLNTIQLKKLEMARALTAKCKVLVLDEVAAGLTPSELNDITKLILKIRDELGVTIIIVEHLMKLIMSVCDRIAVLYFGELLAEGEPKEIMRNKEVVSAYLGEEYIS